MSGTQADCRKGSLSVQASCSNKMQVEWDAYKSQRSFPHRSEGWEVKFKVLADMLSGEAHIPVSIMEPLALSSHSGRQERTGWKAEHSPFCVS